MSGTLFTADFLAEGIVASAAWQDLSDAGVERHARPSVVSSTRLQIEQLPVIPPLELAARFGAKTAAELISDHVLRLTCTADDMTPFARDMGFDGTPFD